MVDIKNNLRIPKPKVKIEKQDSLQLLTDNSFDEYYFKKMNWAYFHLFPNAINIKFYAYSINLKLLIKLI